MCSGEIQFVAEGRRQDVVVKITEIQVVRILHQDRATAVYLVPRVVDLLGVLLRAGNCNNENRIRVRLEGKEEEEKKTDYGDESHATAGEQQEFREPLDSLSCLQPGQKKRKGKKRKERKKDGKARIDERGEKRGWREEKKREKEESESSDGEFDEKVPGKLVAPACSRIILCIPKD